MKLNDIYITPIADALVWMLMPNHFHVLVYIKEGKYYRYSKEDFSTSNAEGLPTPSEFDDLSPSEGVSKMLIIYIVALGISYLLRNLRNENFVT